jgi:hypothetical protein
VEEVLELARPGEVKSAPELEMDVVPITKGEDGFRGYFYGIVLKPNDGKDGPLEPDTQRDVQSADEIIEALRWYSEHGLGRKIQHAIPGDKEFAWIAVRQEIAPVGYWLAGDGTTVPENADWTAKGFEKPDGDRDWSYIPKGTWLMEGKVLGKRLRDGLLSGEFKGLSIGGQAVKTPEKIAAQKS